MQQPAETTDPIADALTAIRWAHDRWGDQLCVTASFGDATLPHVANAAVPGIEVTLLDTGFLFAETRWYADWLRDRFGWRVRIIEPPADAAPDLWQTDTDACCAARKVAPLATALAGRQAWVTGLRRADSSHRATAPFVHDDLLRGVVKVNPLAAWSDADVAEYGRAHDLPEHPLADRGYPSIGCWPCTRPVLDGDDARAGRWAGSTKTECGLHLTHSGVANP